jgi:hypothetical protein
MILQNMQFSIGLHFLMITVYHKKQGSEKPCFEQHGDMDRTRNNILESWGRIEARLERAKALMQQK